MDMWLLAQIKVTGIEFLATFESNGKYVCKASSYCSLGNFKDSEGFRTDLHIFPVGYCASFEDPEAGVFISSIEVSDDGEPQFRVSLKGPDGSTQVSTKSFVHFLKELSWQV